MTLQGRNMFKNTTNKVLLAVFTPLMRRKHSGMSHCKIKVSISVTDLLCFTTRAVGYLYLLNYMHYLKPRLICSPQYTTDEGQCLELALV